jgi:1,4-dihydroxy-2-naphthoate octaprenyltransferase
MDPNNRSLFKYIKPFSLLLSCFTYFLGAGIIIYLGFQMNWTVFLLGLTCVLLIQVSGYLLDIYFESGKTNNLHRTFFDIWQESENQKIEFSRQRLLFLAYATFAVGFVLGLMVILITSFSFTSIIFLLIAIASMLLYSVPPFQWSQTGYGELIQAIFICVLVPTIAYVVQTQELHFLLGTLTLPLPFYFIASGLALSFPNYAADMKYERSTLLTRLGWRRGMSMHNLFILFTYFLFAIESILGLPWFFTWPVMLTLPLGGFQILQIIQISRGARPRWRLLMITAVGGFGLMAYLITFSLWTR